MIWDFGWHHHQQRRVNVEQALALRDAGTLKPGDLFCCRECASQENGTRLHPVDALVRSKFLRRDPRYNEGTVRRECIKIRKSRERGEGWKHARVLDAIEYLLGEGLLSDLGFTNYTRLSGKEGPDFQLHSSDENDTHNLIVVLRNLRRARALRMNLGNAKILYIHRWRDADVDFFAYIRHRMELLYMGSDHDDPSGFHTYQPTKIPFLGLRPDRTATNPFVGRGYTVNITNDLMEGSYEYQQLELIEELTDRVQEHNMWAISTPGMHRYHTKYLTFHPFNGNGTHPDPSVDALLTVLLNMGDYPGPKFQYFPDQISLRTQVLEDEGTISSIIENAAIMFESETGLSPPEDVLESMEEDLRTDLREEINHLQDDKAQIAKAHKDAIEWSNRRFRTKIEKMFEENILEFNSTDEWKVMVEGEWYPLTPPKAVSPASESMRFVALLRAPQLLAPWDKLTTDSKKNCLSELKKLYKEKTYIAGMPMTLTPLVDLEIGEMPSVLLDTQNLAFNIPMSPNNREEQDLSPLDYTDFRRLCYYLSAKRGVAGTMHESYHDLMWASKSSTDHLQKTITISLPQPIEDMLPGEDDPTMEILDLLAKVVTNQDGES